MVSNILLEPGHENEESIIQVLYFFVEIGLILKGLPDCNFQKIFNDLYCVFLFCEGHLLYMLYLEDTEKK